MQFKKPELNARRRRLGKALTIDDLRTIAKRRTPKAAFDYTDGAAEGELSLHRARQAFRTSNSTPASSRPRRASTPRARSSAHPAHCPSGSHRPVHPADADRG